jgi:tetratricopeptide (TPR) repeat protein
MIRLAPFLVTSLFLFAPGAGAAIGDADETPPSREAEAEAGSKEATPMVEPAPARSLTQEKYAEALELIAEAQEIDVHSATISDQTKRHLSNVKARDVYRRALRYLRVAASREPDNYQAHSDIGYVLRRLGDYPEALRAYDRALAIRPDYWRAVEYRGEAYLRLARLEEAKQAYMALFANDRPLADDLLAKMGAWLERRERDPGGMEAKELETFAAWVANRSEIAGQTARLDGEETQAW